MNSNIVFTKFSLRIPEDKNLSVISKKYSEMSFNILSLLPLGENMGSCSLQIKGKSLRRYRTEIVDVFNSFDIHVVVLGSISSYILLNLQIHDVWILKTIIGLQLMLHYPIELKNGVISFQLISDRKKIDHLFAKFDDKRMDYTLKEIGMYRPKNLLTEKQEGILRDALDFGYYEIPRKISLSDLAKKYGISPSALSETFRRIEKKLGQDYKKRIIHN